MSCPRGTDGVTEDHAILYFIVSTDLAHVLYLYSSAEAWNNYDSSRDKVCFAIVLDHETGKPQLYSSLCLCTFSKFSLLPERSSKAHPSIVITVKKFLEN